VCVCVCVCVGGQLSKGPASVIHEKNVHMVFVFHMPSHTFPVWTCHELRSCSVVLQVDLCLDISYGKLFHFIAPKPFTVCCMSHSMAVLTTELCLVVVNSRQFET